uniref:uncharacterized protein LOC120815074 isoform X1 n=1 Tax=Gasterosteus aculeatus aculeatus TaxID=481459 RepID=UPI001A97FBA1|nr:uncharacterized protein LOC120815074 isoform X1 [Gasterosteus aculeatus aculeatus]
MRSSGATSSPPWSPSPHRGSTVTWRTEDPDAEKNKTRRNPDHDKYVADFGFFDKVAKTKTAPVFKPCSPQRAYQSNGAGPVPDVSDPEKIRLEQNYRDRGGERGRARDTPLSVRISNV